MVRIRLEPQDDYLHPVEEASNFNESRYYNFFGPACGLGGWVRMGNRPNEGYAEMTTCFYLPDGRLGGTVCRACVRRVVLPVDGRAPLR